MGRLHSFIYESPAAVRIFNFLTKYDHFAMARINTIALSVMGALKIEDKILNLMQHTADTLIQNGLIKNYSEFSRIYCGRTENYFYRQRFFARCFSRGALINTAIRLHKANQHYDKYANIFESEKNVLTVLEERLLAELREKYRIKELVF